MLGRRYSPSFLQGTRPRFASDTLMSLRAIPSFLAWLPSVAMGNIYTSVHLWFRGSWNPAGSLGCAVVPCVRPVPSELGRGRAVAVWSVAWWLDVLHVGWGGLSRFSVSLGGWKFRLVRRVFRKRPQGVTRTLSAAKRGRAERPGDGCPCVGAEETCGVAAMLHGGLVLIAFQSVTPVRASPNTAVN